MNHLSTVCFTLLALFFTAATVHADDPEPPIPPLPEMVDGAHICGSMILPEIVDLDLEVDNNNQNRSIHDEDSPDEGDREEFWVINFEESGATPAYEEVTFELMAISDQSEIWVEVGEQGEDQINEEVVEDVQREMDVQTAQESWDPQSGIVDNGRELFGEPPDRDESGRVKVLLADIQDGWESDEGGGFIAGYFSPVDQQMLHPHSNQADIIYINTYPGIYRDDREPDASRRFGTLAHEYQHLIHYSYGNLNTFQNEGQSEVAEIIMGYRARTMRWLDEPEEVDGTVEADSNPEGLYRWRRNSSNILMDYQRAQLLHSYIYEITDAEKTASITRASSDGREAYLETLDKVSISWNVFLRDFQVTNRLNNPDVAEGQYGYTTFQLEDVQAEGIGRDHSRPLLSVAQNEEEVDVGYGGGFYSRFESPEDLEVELEGDDHIAWAAIVSDNDNGDEVRILKEGSEWFEGSYDEIVLVGSNFREEGSDEENPGQRNYTYTFEFGVISHIAGGEEKPAKFVLFDAYPNPFNPVTVISYQLPVESEVRLEVYNMPGRQITTLVSEQQPAGRYKVSFDATDLSSGTYLYRIEVSAANPDRVGAGEHAETGKMMLIK